jgi:glycine oxidase
MLIHESWAGLRPGTPDKLPILGDTRLKNYFVATGHYRNGILLAPITAKIMADIISGDRPQFDLSKFVLSRFGKQ